MNAPNFAAVTAAMRADRVDAIQRERRDLAAWAQSIDARRVAAEPDADSGAHFIASHIDRLPTIRDADAVVILAALFRGMQRTDFGYTSVARKHCYVAIDEMCDELDVGVPQ